jgi:glycerol-3-phosphate dehydrogenase (NAD(P)+)
VIGGGGFGTALAKLLAEINHDVVLWCHNPDVAEAIAERRENPVYLPGVSLPLGVRVTASREEVVHRAEMLLAMGPSHVLREVMTSIRPFVKGNPLVVSAAKGIEETTHKRMSEVLIDVLGPSFSGRIAALSGPSFAPEIAAGMPTAVTVAAPDAATCRAVQLALRTPTFRLYSSSDIIGVEIGGAAKNVIAIAAGVSDGLGLGGSSRAALITRGVAEIGRLVDAMGGDSRTVSGLSGVGDIVLTCTGDLSRNRTVGLRIGRGERLRDILAGMKMVAEGVRNSISVCALAKQNGTEMPIAEQVRQLLHDEKPPRQVLGEFMRRRSKPEF